jgi:RimJ/RimL family protein N-acetyltransferase
MLLSGDLSRTLITSARLTIRAFTGADAAESFAEANARVAKFMSRNPPAFETEFKTIWQKGISDMKTGKELHLVVRLTTTNEFIGSAGLHPADATLLESGLWIKESAQGRGYGREAVAAVIKWASERFRPSGFLYPVVDEDTASRRLAEALGGEIIGRDKDRKLLLYGMPTPV